MMVVSTFYANFAAAACTRCFVVHLSLSQVNQEGPITPRGRLYAALGKSAGFDVPVALAMVGANTTSKICTWMAAELGAGLGPQQPSG